MASKGVITDVVDVGRVESQIKTLKTGLEGLILQFTTLATKIDVMNTSLEGAKGMQEIIDLIKKNEKANADAKVAADAYNKTQVALAASQQLLIKVQREAESQTKRTAKTTGGQVIATERLTKGTVQLDRQRQRAMNQAAKIEAKERELQAAMTMSVRSIADLEKKNNALISARRKLDQTTVTGKKRFAELTAEIKRNSAALLQQDRQIGRNQRNVGNYVSALAGLGRQLMGGLGITAGVYGLVRAFKGIIATSRDFEKQSAVLAGVLDVSKESLKELTSQAIRLGGKYPTLAKEVLELQTAYARLGFTQKEILKLTEGTIVGSFSLNASLDDTAALVGTVVRSYDELSATDANMIIDQLTRSTQKSSLSFESLTTALPKVAGAANALNIPLNETLAVLGTAIDATQDASIAGTGYRKILLSNAKAGRTLEDGLKIINTSTNKVSTAQELYGDRAAVVALALANQIEKTKELSGEIMDSFGVASRDAAKKMDTMAGAIAGVSSSWERFTLMMNNSNGAIKGFLENLSYAIDSLTTLSHLDLKTQIGAFLSNLVGYGKDAKKERAKKLKEEQDYLAQLSIQGLKDILPTQQAIIDKYEKEGETAMVTAARNRLAWMEETIAERTKTEAEAEAKKADALAALLKEDADKEEEERKKQLAADKEHQTRKLTLIKETASLQLEAMDKTAPEYLQKMIEKLNAERDLELFNATDTGLKKADINAKYNKIISDETKAAADKSLADLIALTDKETQSVLMAADKRKQIEIAALSDKLKSGKLTVEQYNDELKVIERNATNDSTRLALEAAKDKLAILEAAGADIEMVQKSIFDLEKMLSDDETAHFIENQIKKTEAAEKELAEREALDREHSEKQKELLEEISESIIEITNGTFDRQVMKINELSRKDDEAKQRELAVAGDNADRKEQIESKYAAREKQRDAERRKLQQQQATFNKAAAMIQIAIDTARAIMNVMATIPVFAQPPFIAIAAAIGAVQLAAVAAQPIPKYARGREGGKAELAWVGEQGHEAIKTATGETFITPNRPTLAWLPERADVISNKDLMMAAANMTMNRLPFDQALSLSKMQQVNINSDNSDVVARINETNDLLKKFKFMSADGKKVMDINGNLVRYV